MHTTAYMARPDCESHWNFGEIIELPMRASTTTFEELLRFARADLGHEAVIEMDQEIILALTCPNCQKIEKVIKPISEVTFESAHCPTCGTLRETEMTHLITGEEPFLHLPLGELGIPPLHILRAYNTEEYRFYVLTGDLQEALHFNDFDRSAPTRAEIIRERIRIGATITAEDPESGSTRGKIVILSLNHYTVPCTISFPSKQI